MTRLVLDAARVGDFVARGLGCPLVPPYTGFGLETDAGNMTTGALFHEHTGAQITVAVYAPGAFRLGFIRAIMNYAFVQLGCVRLTARPRRKDKAMRMFLPKLGFVYEGTMRRFYEAAPAGDAFLFGLMRENAGRWLK